ncbi:enoyl-CoA hydratase-related protein [Marivita hallyeonensis]|uniref:3-hydroxyacyl-CoA dehydrogenase n=1 Tax=Marivita hallyeonensis TaxID=996342 RepID=A0A1M5NXL7_9RHOB|nr:enoyl-CoA hydratase-related protein [Marivita hallyeonensis]SHG94237.1 3-hydroxyacyl-CoA dehydrogenase [Marivita hallyeonensis]
MSTQADIVVESGIAHVAINAGPSARLSKTVLEQIDAALTRVEDEEAVNTVVLSGKGGAFPSGLTDPLADGDDTDNRLATLCTRIEGFGKPVIAVLRGVIVGGGAELALACHYRLAHKDARMGFPQVRLGLIPNAGATQRLPRLVGAAPSVELLIEGHLLPLATQPLVQLVDQVFEGDTFQAISAFIETAQPHTVPPRKTSNIRTGFANPQAYQSALTQTRDRLSTSHETAPRHILSALEAALVLPMDAGLAFEGAAYEDCLETPQARAMAHAFHIEQTARNTIRRSDIPKMGRVAILGGGTLAIQFAQLALEQGLKVNWAIKNDAQRRESTVQLNARLMEKVQRGRMGLGKLKQCQAALRHGPPHEMLVDVDIALRAARGQRGVAVPQGLLVAQAIPGREPRLSFRLGPAATATRLAEIILGPDGADDDLKKALGLAKDMNLLAVVQHSDGPSLFDRLTEALWRASDRLVDLGWSPYQIDDAMRAWGMATPPYELADASGLLAVSRNDRAEGCTNWAHVLVEAGRHGPGQGHGAYRYDESGRRQPDDAVIALLNKARPPEPDGQPTRIAPLLIGAMANEAARALRENAISQASDADLVSILTGLIPRWKGGVLHAASAEGLLHISREMTAIADRDTAFWTPDPLFEDLIKNGKSFDQL